MTNPGNEISHKIYSVVDQLDYKELYPFVNDNSSKDITLWNFYESQIDIKLKTRFQVFIEVEEKIIKYFKDEH